MVACESLLIAASALSGAAEVDVFPWWSRASEEQIAAMLAGEQHQAEEHEAAKLRIYEQAHEGDVEVISAGVVIRRRSAPDPDAEVRSGDAEFSLLHEMAKDPSSGLEEIEPGVFRSRKDAADWDH